MSRLREKYLKLNDDMDRRDAEMAETFLATVKGDVNDFVKEQFDKGGNVQTVLQAVVVDLLTVGYFAGRKDERSFLRNVIFDKLRREQKNLPT